MFESLGNRFSDAFASLRSRGKLSSSDISNVCQEIRQALLDADVALSVVEGFVSKIEVEAKAALDDLQAGANQAQVIFEIVNKELVELPAGERIAQCVFQKFLKADNDQVLQEKREGGIGSSGKN